jgi:hypothetical protein
MARPRRALLGGTAAGAAILVLVAAWIWWSGAADPSGCPRTLSRSAPPTIDDASQMIAVCGPEDVRVRLLSASLPDVVNYRSPELPPSAWLAPQSPLYRHLTELGFQYPDDMSFAVLSAAWHRTRGLPFDARALAACLQAWNRKMQLWIESVPPGSQIPAPEFGCATPEEIDKGRHLWPKG